MVKFDIVSGFLGAGKTTLIRKLLNALRDEKVVIIENEYGETQIDKDVLSVAGFEIYELTNGCVCCTLKEDFRLTLKEILNEKVDRIIFEPSGIFILSEIFELFRDLQISSRCALNSVTTVVDALHFFKHITGFSRFFTNQIELASSLVISKSQFVDPEEIKNIEAELRNINDSAKILTVNWESLSDQELVNLLASKTERASRKWPVPSLHDSLEHDFESFGTETMRVFEAEELEEILRMLSKGIYGDVLRGKGVVPSQGSFLEFNYVDGDYEIRELKEGARGAVSFIGTTLRNEKLRELFL